MGIEPTVPLLAQSTIGFEDRAAHQLQTRFHLQNHTGFSNRQGCRREAHYTYDVSSRSPSTYDRVSPRVWRGVARRHPRKKLGATWAGATIALALHAALVVSLHAVDTAAAFGSRPRPGAAAGFQPGCVTDVALASSARLALCFAPWQSELAACLNDAEWSARLDLASCRTDLDSDVAQVAVLDASAAERMRSLDPAQLLSAIAERNKPEPTRAAAPPERPSPPPQPTRASQVVETAKPLEQKPPDNARFLAEYDSRVEKQTVARGAVKEPMIANPKPSAQAPTLVPHETSANPGMLAMRNPGGSAGQAIARERGSLTGVTGNPSASGTLAPKGQGAISQGDRDRSELAPGMGAASGGASVPSLKPTTDVLERVAGGGSVDHLDDVETGDVTALSAKRWVYASFFNRLKRQVAQNWDPASVWRRTDPNGQVYGLKTRVTEVRVSLSTSGQVAKIVVVTPSGVGDLDDEALRAFRAAGPFPNPPQDLAGPDRLITFAFAFYFEIGAPRTSWRVIRSM